MLYSICSMPCWVNKSNLVCADEGWSHVSVILHFISGETGPACWNLRSRGWYGVVGGDSGAKAWSRTLSRG